MISSSPANTTTIPQKVDPVDQFSKLRRLKHDRGAVLVEAAIAIPLLLFVILGSLEFGVAWEAKSSTTNGMRSGLLRAATLADQPQTDLRVLQSIVGEVGADNADRISWVVIFDADPVNGSLDDIVDDCATAAATGGSRDHCVVYSDTTIQNVATTTDAAMFLMDNFDNGMGFNEATGVYTCQMGNLDTGEFCAGSRTVNGDIEVGVAFEYEHEWLTGILPFNEPTFRELQTTSTFAVDGIEISASSPVVLGGGVIDVDFSEGAIPPNLTGGTLGNVGGQDVFVPDTVSAPGAEPLRQRATISVDITGADTMVCIDDLGLVLEGSWNDSGSNADRIDFTLSQTGEMRTRGDFDFSDGVHTTDGTPPGCFDVTGLGPTEVEIVVQSQTTNTDEKFYFDNLQVDRV